MSKFLLTTSGVLNGRNFHRFRLPNSFPIRHQTREVVRRRQAPCPGQLQKEISSFGVSRTMPASIRSCRGVAEEKFASSAFSTASKHSGLALFFDILGDSPISLDGRLGEASLPSRVGGNPFPRSILFSGGHQDHRLAGNFLPQAGRGGGWASPIITALMEKVRHLGDCGARKNPWR